MEQFHQQMIQMLIRVCTTSKCAERECVFLVSWKFNLWLCSSQQLHKVSWEQQQETNSCFFQQQPPFNMVHAAVWLWLLVLKTKSKENISLEFQVSKKPSHLLEAVKKKTPVWIKINSNNIVWKAKKNEPLPLSLKTLNLNLILNLKGLPEHT